MDRRSGARAATPQRVAATTPERPTHPTFVAAALMIGITLLLVLVAALGTVR